MQRIALTAATQRWSDCDSSQLKWRVARVRGAACDQHSSERHDLRVCRVQLSCPLSVSPVRVCVCACVRVQLAA